MKSEPCFETTGDNSPELLRELQNLPLDAKIEYSKRLIWQFYHVADRKIYVSFSGGRDSTVLLHLVRSVYASTPAVFFDTGLEFPEIREFVNSKENIEIVRPAMSFRQVIKEYGYPIGGKNMAHWIDLAQRGQPSGIRQMSADTKYGYKKYAWLVDAPFRISEKCCDKLKKEPATRYHNETGRSPLIGTRAEESVIRAQTWVNSGEINKDSAIKSCTPLSIWRDADVKEYIRRFNLEISPIYSKGYDRTGCAYCMFGIFSDPGRFVKLKHTHPQLWAYCMKDYDKGGIGLEKVLDFIKIDSGRSQSSLVDFSEAES